MDLSLVFVFIFVIIVIGFLLVGGINLVTRFFGLGEDLQVERQAAEFELAVYSKEKKTGIFWTTTGSSEEFNFFIGSGVEKVCFLDPQNPRDNPAKGWIDEYDYQELIKDNGFNLVYFISGKGLKGFTLDKFKPEENSCITSTTNLLLTNKGSYVDIREA